MRLRIKEIKLVENPRTFGWDREVVNTHEVMATTIRGALALYPDAEDLEYEILSD